ncbi:MAG: FAD binding domain-containing protein [Armatimonadetes bacterium]|nr:FAD binding domain-containing protein [Armatimonadota bacterium]
MEFEVKSPGTRSELLSAIIKTRTGFRFGAGYTDLIPELRKNGSPVRTIINLARLNDKRFTAITVTKRGIRIGALVTAARLADDPTIREYLPVLAQATSDMASPQIRQVATIGGNLCTASPAGDGACALMALEAECELLNSRNQARTITLASFFLGPRKTALERDELLQSVFVPANSGVRLFSGFIKVGTRRSMECSVVSLAYHVQTDSSGNVVHSGIAIGSAAPVIRFAHSACSLLLGKNLETMTVQDAGRFAQNVLEHASPISDLRASAWYRRQVLFNISKALFSERQGAAETNGSYEGKAHELH